MRKQGKYITRTEKNKGFPKKVEKPLSVGYNTDKAPNIIFEYGGRL